jgi:hypothetical protein
VTAVSEVPYDIGPAARFKALKEEVDVPEEVFRLLTDPDEGQSLDEIAKAWRVPRGKFVEWYTTEHAGRYDAALKVLGVSLGHRVLELTQNATRETVGLVKMQTDRYLRLASHWDAQRYSPRVEHNHSGQQPVFNVVLLSVPSDGRRVIENEPPLPAVSAPVVEQDLI